MKLAGDFGFDYIHRMRLFSFSEDLACTHKRLSARETGLESYMRIFQPGKGKEALLEISVKQANPFKRTSSPHIKGPLH